MLVYERKTGSLASGKEMYLPCDFDLYSLLTSGRDCLVEGIRLLNKGTPEWHEYIKEFTKRVSDRYSGEDARKMIIERTGLPVIHAPSNFGGIKYAYAAGFRDVVTDYKRNMIGNILVTEKKIVVLPNIKPTGRSYIDSAGGDASNAFSHGSFVYDGSIEDAFNEFSVHGFAFACARWPSDTKETMQLQSKGMKYIITHDNISAPIKLK